MTCEIEQFFIQQIRQSDGVKPKEETVQTLTSLLQVLKNKGVPSPCIISEDPHGNVYMSWNFAFCFLHGNSLEWTVTDNKGRRIKVETSIEELIVSLYKG